jgi:hypothetical protein
MDHGVNMNRQISDRVAATIAAQEARDERSAKRIRDRTAKTEVVRVRVSPGLLRAIDTIVADGQRRGAFPLSRSAFFRMGAADQVQQRLEDLREQARRTSDPDERRRITAEAKALGQWTVAGLQ